MSCIPVLCTWDGLHVGIALLGWAVLSPLLTRMSAPETQDKELLSGLG